jgi:alpha-glucosidase
MSPKSFALIVVTFLSCTQPASLYAAGTVVETMAPGKLIWDADALPSAKYQLGPFHVTWSSDTGKLAVVDGERPGKELWSNVPGSAFIGAATGNAEIDYFRGFTALVDRLSDRYASQEIHQIRFAGKRLILDGCLGDGQACLPYDMIFEVNGFGHIDFQASLHDDVINRLFLYTRSEPDEAVWGFGEQFSEVNFKGKKLSVLVTEKGFGRGMEPVTSYLDGKYPQHNVTGDWFSSYAPVPHYLTSSMRSVYMRNYEYISYDLTRNGLIITDVFSGHIEGTILAGNSPIELIREYTEYSGRMQALPDWAINGAIIGMQGGTEKVRAVYRELKQRGTPVAAFWLQDWQGQRSMSEVHKRLWWNWSLDKERYPGWHELVADLNADGVRVLGYINPFFVTDIDKGPAHDRNMFREAEALGYLVRDRRGQAYRFDNSGFHSGLLDLTHPGARSWMKEIIRKELIGAGLSGWMADFGEAIPLDVVLHSGETGWTYHNRFPEDWAQLNREAVTEAKAQDEVVFFMRAGFRRTPAYATLFWAGDQVTSWDRHDGLKSSLFAILNSGLSGYSFNHSDIGGYAAFRIPGEHMNVSRNRELYYRWMEVNALTGTFRTHEGATPSATLQFYDDEDSYREFDYYAKLYHSLFFYRQQLAREASRTGLPMVRHLFIHYPEIRETWSLDSGQFMLGSELIVAPVLEPQSNSVEVFLPHGTWVDLWTQQSTVIEVPGQTRVVPAPLGKPAIFYPAGSAVGQQFRKNIENLGLLRR